MKKIVVYLWIIFSFIMIICCKNNYPIGRIFSDYVSKLEFKGEYNWVGFTRQVVFEKIDMHGTRSSKEYLDG